MFIFEGGLSLYWLMLSEVVIQEVTDYLCSRFVNEKGTKIFFKLLLCMYLNNIWNPVYRSLNKFSKIIFFFFCGGWGIIMIIKLRNICILFGIIELYTIDDKKRKKKKKEIKKDIRTSWLNTQSVAVKQ